MAIGNDMAMIDAETMLRIANQRIHENLKHLEQEHQMSQAHNNDIAESRPVPGALLVPDSRQFIGALLVRAGVRLHGSVSVSTDGTTLSI